MPSSTPASPRAVPRRVRAGIALRRVFAALPRLAWTPAPCVGCGAPAPAAGLHGALCDDCRAVFARPRWRCVRCARPLVALDGPGEHDTPLPGPNVDADAEPSGCAPRPNRCAPCIVAAGRSRDDASALASVAVAVDYALPWDRLVARWKYHDGTALTPLFVATMLAAARAFAPPWWPLRPRTHAQPDLLVPVPLSDARLAERGHDQAWLLARGLARALDAATGARLQRRLADTPHQVGTDRATRLAAQRDALRRALWVTPRGAALARGRRIVLVDDVVTTGATAEAAAAGWRDAGASEVHLWAFARTPAPDEASAR